MATVQQRGTGHETVLEEALTQVTRRLRLDRWVRHASRGALAGIVAALIAVTLAHFDLLPAWLPLEAVIPIALLLGAGIGTLTAFARPIATMDAARLVETRLGLKERLSSALEFERSGPAPHDPEAALLLRLQQEDAAAHARMLKPAEAIPLRLPWEARALIPAVLLLLLALILPSLPVFIPAPLRTERAIVKKSGEKLTRTARLIEKQADAQHMDATRRAAQNMRKLGEQMARGKMDKKQAMVKMAQLTKQMQQQQRQMAQANSGLGEGGKSLAQAGQQLAQALQSLAAQGRNTPGTGAKPASANAPKGNPRANGKAGRKNGQANGAQGAGKNGGQKGQKGFNIPGMAGHKPGDKSGQGDRKSGAGQKGQSTPEMQKAARAMQQGNTPGLSEQLRQLAQRAEAGKMSGAEQRQAGQDLQKLADALKGTPLSETQKHAQAAADALKRGDRAKAADEMRKAAAAAERETQQQMDKQGMQDAQSSLQSSQGEMAEASSPGDISSGDSGRGGQQGQSGSGQGQGQFNSGKGPAQGNGKFNDMGQDGSSDSGQGGSPGNMGEGKGGPNKPGPGHYTPESGVGFKTPKQNMGVWRGKVHPLDPKFDPARNPKYGKIYLGAPGSGAQGGGKSGPLVKTLPGAQSQPGQHNVSSVPYYNYVAPYKKAEESAMDKEDIPPAYRNIVRRYYGDIEKSPATKSGGASR